MNITTHVLKMTCGTTCTMRHNGTTGQFDCLWSTPPPTDKRLHKQFLSEYEPWRDGIIAEWARRTGRSAVLFKAL